MNVKNLTYSSSCALISVAVISYCLAQSQHPRPFAGSTTARSRPYNAALQARDQKYDLLVEQGDRLRTTDPAAAEAYYSQATSINPQPSDAWMGLARSSDTQGKTSQALSAYRHVFDSTNSGMYSSFPSDVEALARYGTLCENAGEHGAAIRAYNNAGERFNPKPVVPLSVPLDRQVTSPELHAMLEVVRGIALDQQGKKSESLGAFTQAASFQPTDARVQFYLGHGLRKAGRFAEAASAFRKAAQLDTEGTVKAAADENLQAVQAHRP